MGVQAVSEHVGDQPVELFGHGSVPRSQARLDVDHRDVELAGYQGAGHGRVDVSDDDHAVRAIVQTASLELHHYLGCLLSVAAAADAQHPIGLRDTQVLEEHGRELRIVVLPGVHQDGAHALVAAQGSQHGGNFGEVWAGADHEGYGQ